ncbi:MAG: thiopurine S-methyltransferase [Pseudomonadota bacterium]
MEAAFWHDRWASRQINFHEGEANRYLTEHWDTLALPNGSRVFVPLSGKTRDIPWLMSQGHAVVACELSQTAIDELFEDLGVVPTVTEHGAFRHHAIEGLDVFVGDVFALTPDVLAQVDAIYDRAAVVALPDAMRSDYAAHLAQITNLAPQLVVAFEYEQAVMGGPPFAIWPKMMTALYGANYDLELLDRSPVPGGLKGNSDVQETAWRLSPKVD